MENFIKIILEASVTAGIAVFAVMLIRLAMKKAPKMWAYALWAVVFFRCLCPFSVESGLSVFNAVNAVPERTAEVEQLETLPQMAENSEIENILPVHTNLNTYGYQTAAPVYPAVLEDVPAAEAVPTKKPVNKYAIMFAVWAVGTGAMALYGIVSYVLLMGRLRTAVKTEEGVYESDRISTAFSAGFFPPKIYLPCGLFEEEKKLIVAHERVHIRRLDYIVKPVAFLALAVHWFNPLIWLAFALMTRDMELSCDEAVLKIFGAGEKKAYSEALLRVSMKRSGLADNYGFLPLAFAETGIKGRVRNVLKYKKPTVIVTVIAAVVVVAACVVLGTNAKSADDATGGEIEYAMLSNSDGLTEKLTDVNGNNIYFAVTNNYSDKSGVYLSDDYDFDKAFFEAQSVPDFDPENAADFDINAVNRFVTDIDIDELKINALEIYEEGGKRFLKAEFNIVTEENPTLFMRDDLIRLDGEYETKLFFVEWGGETDVSVRAEYELTQNWENGDYVFVLKGFGDIPVYVNKELLREDEIKYVDYQSGRASRLRDDNGNKIYLYVDKNFYDDPHETDGVYYSRALIEGEEVQGMDSMAFSFGDGSLKKLIMAVDMTELKINSLEVFNEDGKSFLKTQLEFTLAEDAVQPIKDGLIRYGGDEEPRLLTIEGGGKDRAYTVSAEYELTQNGENGYAFILKDFEDIPVYVNAELVKEKEQNYDALEVGETSYSFESGENVVINKYANMVRTYPEGQIPYHQVISGNENLSLDGHIPAYFVCGYSPSSTGVISHSDNADGNSGVVSYESFNNDFEWSFQNAYLGGVSQITVNPAGDNCVHILGMKTKSDFTAADSVLNFGDFTINEITLEDMYTEKSGGRVKLYTKIKVEAPDEDGLMNNMAVNDGSYEMAVAKSADGGYVFTVITDYSANDVDSFGVVLEGFTWQKKYVHPKLVLDSWYNADGKEVTYENAKIEKIYKLDFSKFIALYDNGTFAYTDYLSSYMAVPNSCREYRYEGGSLILTFDDGSELCFDETYSTGESSKAALMFNEKASRRTDARSRDIPWFSDGAVFTFDEEWLISLQINERRKSSYQYESFIDYNMTEMVYSRDIWSIYLFNDGNFDVADFSDKYIPQNDLRDGYSIDGDTLSLKYTDGSVLCFDMISSAMDATDPELTAEMEMCRYKLVYRKEKSHISEEQEGDIPEFYNGELFDPDEEFIRLKKEVKEMRAVEEQERLRAEEVLKSSYPALQYPVSANINTAYSEDNVDFHNGIDFAVQEGTPVYAAGKGTVINADDDQNGYGLCVIIDHGAGEMHTLYAHLSEISVNEGDEVNAGDLIGYSGKTGNTYGAQLHFEVCIDGQHVDPAEYISPDLRYPVDGVVTSGYGDGRGHKGIDFAAEKGTKVYAAADGTVSETGSGWNGGYGNSVTLRHVGTMETVYAHMDEILVKEGDEVNAGDLIGYSGSTGDTVYEKLHFEVRIDGQHVDPMDYLQ